MCQKNATQSMRKMMIFCVAAATCGTLLLTPPVGAQTSAGGTATTATGDNTDASAQGGTMAPQHTTGTTPGAMGMGKMQPTTVQPATGPIAATEAGNTFYSGGRRFPWGLLGLIGLLGLWPRSRVTVDRTNV